MNVNLSNASSTINRDTSTSSELQKSQASAEQPIIETTELPKQSTAADTVSISEQGALQQVDDSSESNSSKSQVTSGNDFVRVTTSVGRASSSGGLTNEDALSLYQSISRLL